MSTFDRRTDEWSLPGPGDRDRSGDPERRDGGLPTGTGLGKYRILERIRATPTAILYKARDTLLDRLVAIKQMNPGAIDDPVTCGHFRREAQMMARFAGDHRHVIGIHELIEDDHGLFIVHEFADGRWLESLVAKRELDGEKALRIFGTAALGLRTLHAARIVHRDLRPANLVVVPSVGARIADLSCAAVEGDCAVPCLHAPKYAAPELQLAREYDDRVDLYSLGFMMYEICVGRPPLHEFFSDVLADPQAADQRWKEWHCNLEVPLPPASELNPAVPRVLDVLLAKMTAKRLDERCTSIDEVIAALAAFFKARRLDAERRLNGGRAAPRLASIHSRPTSLTAAAPRLLTGVQAAPPVPYGHTSLSLRSVVSPLAHTPRSTSTHRVPTVGRAAQSDAPAQPSTAPHPTPANSDFRPTPAPAPRSHRRHAGRSSGKPRPAPVASVPVPEPVVEVARPRSLRSMVTAPVVLVLAALFIGGAVLWNSRFAGGASRGVESTIAEAVQRYDAGDLDGARDQFQAARQAAGRAGLVDLCDTVDHWVLLVDATMSLARDRFDLAEERLRLAENHGADKSRVEALRARIYRRKDQIRLAAEVESGLARGDLVNAELKLRTYERTPDADANVAAGFRERVANTRENSKYDQALQTARAQMERGNYAAALLACTAARQIRMSDEIRDLEQKVSDMQTRDEWVNRAKTATLEKDYASAVIAFEKANRLVPSAEIEALVRESRARLAYEQAKKAAAEGDLLLAQQLLKTSIWNAPLPGAMRKLERMKPAFEAAELEHEADRALESKDFAEACRLFEAALPRLPAAAQDRVRPKLATARRGDLLARGDRAAERGNWSDALQSFTEAARLGPAPEIDARIQKAQSKLP